MEGWITVVLNIVFVILRFLVSRMFCNQCKQQQKLGKFLIPILSMLHRIGRLIIRIHFIYRDKKRSGNRGTSYKNF